MKNIAIILVALLIASCNTETKNQKSKNISQQKEEVSPKIKSQPSVDYFNIEAPSFSDTAIYSSTVKFKLTLKDSIQKLDSILVYVDGKPIHTDFNNEFTISLTPQKVGSNIISIEGYKDGLSQKRSVKLFFLSNIKPKSIKYKLINTYPHSTDNFTEGFIYQNGLLYESTGNYGKSALFISKLETGEVLQSTYLPSNKFGEGIAILNNTITQLTYTATKAYVYDKNTLKKIRSFDYPFYSEGWGLTTDGKDFIMSNGSDKIKVLDSLYFQPQKEITVCDDKGSIDSLNELEYVQGILYSNIWMENKIVKIEYKTGRVLGYLDLKAIIPKKYQNVQDAVLNGIAYREEKNTLLVTGKNWETIYEIKLEDN